MAMPEEAQPQAAPEGGSGGVTEFVVGLSAGLRKLTELLSQNQEVNPEAVQMIGQASQMFDQGLQALTGGGGAAPKGGQPVSMEQGARETMPAY